MKIERFVIDIPDARLAEMRRRLVQAEWPDDWANADWQYGVERGWLRDMVSYWTQDFDWRAEEARMNAFPHFQTEIDGFPIHFIHVRGKGPNPFPLILTHGWPWTFWDWKDVIGPLSDPAAHGGDPADAFDVIVPSLPGFTFSSPLRQQGVTVRNIAKLWVRLMRDGLGYNRFAAAGGDWGALVTVELGHAHAEHLTGVHVSLPVLPGEVDWAITREMFGPDEGWMYDRVQAAKPLIASHMAVHIHDPQTLAYALADSPLGTAAWLWERRRSWSDCDGDPIGLFGRDFLCATASLFWLTGTIGSSLRIYKDHFSSPWGLVHDRMPVIPVPTGFAIAPKELMMVPRARAEARTNLKRWTILPRGGHFAPAEFPTELVGEYRAFFADLRA